MIKKILLTTIGGPPARAHYFIVNPAYRADLEAAAPPGTPRESNGSIEVIYDRFCPLRDTDDPEAVPMFEGLCLSIGGAP